MDEHPFAFACAGATAIAIVHLPSDPGPRGVLMVVGGPQYRAGCGRQFVGLARALAQAGVAVMRFDLPGMGDSDGAAPGFEAADPAIAAAVGAFFERAPNLREVVLWGLCDGASAGMLYAPSDARVTGLVLANPWCRSAGGEARSQLLHYYPARLVSGALWRKLVAGGMNWRGTFAGLVGALRRAVGRRDPSGLPDRLADRMARFKGNSLVLLSGRDLVAREFELAAGTRRPLRGRRVRWHRLPKADHTFSRKIWRDEVAEVTLRWLASW